MDNQRITISWQDQSVSGLIMIPPKSRVMVILGHGAGAGMSHSFMEQLAQDLAAQGMASLRYNFPYMEAGKRSPNAPKLSQATVRAAVDYAAQHFPEYHLLAGGKSYGGRMTSQAQAETPLAGVNGLVFFGFPLHAPGRPGAQRGEHLKDINIPMLFLQGSRDKLADLTLLSPLLQSIGKLVDLVVIEGADHGFNMLKSSGISSEQARLNLAQQTWQWYKKLMKD